MIAVGGGALEKAEELGRRLLAENISPQIIGGTVYVAAEDAERARAIAGLQEPPPELLQPAPFHPCPKCGTPDPLWYGKRKAVAFLALLAVVITLALLQSQAVVFVGIAVFIAFLIAVKVIPEWECRNCGHRWQKEPVD